MTEHADQPTQEQGSFSSGILVGFLAGAVGYFITQTKEGKEIKDSFMDHWHGLREKLIAEGKLSESELEITDYIAAARSKIGEFLGECVDLSDSKSGKKVAKKTPKRKKKIFKGI